VARRRYALTAAAIVGIAAFVLYHATLCPTWTRDTPSFQARIGTALLTPRDGYPLYTALGTVFH
jgi:hypothetical protein